MQKSSILLDGHQVDLLEANKSFSETELIMEIPEVYKI